MVKSRLARTLHATPARREAHFLRFMGLFFCLALNTGSLRPMPARPLVSVRL